MLSASCRAVLILFCFDLMAVSTEAVSQEKITFTKPALIEFGDGPIFDSVTIRDCFKRKLETAAKSWGADEAIFQVNRCLRSSGRSLLIAETARPMLNRALIGGSRFHPRKSAQWCGADFLIVDHFDEMSIRQTAHRLVRSPSFTRRRGPIAFPN